MYVLPPRQPITAAETIDRIVHQIVTNDHKSDLTDAQRARGIQQMIDAGLSVSKVAKKLAVGKDTVTAAQAAAKSSVALEALEGGQISLAEAGALTEFEHDGPEPVDRLAGRWHTAIRPRGVPAALRAGQRTGLGRSRATTPSGASPSSTRSSDGAGTRTGCRCATCSATVTTASPRSRRIGDHRPAALGRLAR